MRKWMVLFLGMVLTLPGFWAQAASNDAELTAIKAEIAQLKANYNQLASQIAQNKKAIEEMSRYVAENMEARKHFFLGVEKKTNEINGRIDSTEKLMAVLTQKQNDYEKAIVELAQYVEKDIRDRQGFFQAVADVEKKRVEREVTNTDAALRILATLGATKESTQGRKIIRQGSGDSYRKDSESRKIQPIKKSFVALENDPFHEVSPRFSDRAKTAEPARTIRIVHYAQRIPSRTSYNTPHADIANDGGKDDDRDEHKVFYTKIDWGFLH